MKLLLYGLLFSMFPVMFLFKFSHEYIKRDSGSKLLAFVSVFVFWLHGVASVLYINYRLDNSSLDIYYIKVLEKGESSGKSGKSYWIEAVQNGPIENKRKFMVNRITYSNIQKGDLMELELHNGLLGIAWLKLRQ
ncbi:MAG: hypothetical protein JNM67_06020 [Bacteroidetes bacterium]|nr:hypothetical protein [Bacteroidota bacterium]